MMSVASRDVTSFIPDFGNLCCFFLIDFVINQAEDY